MILEPVHAQLVIGARGIAAGQAVVAVPSYSWAVFSNPAVLPNEEMTFGFYGLRNYGFAELTDMAAVAVLPVSVGVVAAGVHHFGDSRLYKTDMRAAYKNEWKNLHAGFSVHYNHLAFGGGYGKTGALGIDIGLAAELSQGLWLGARSVNITRQSYHNSREELYHDLAMGLSYSLAERGTFMFDVVKDVRYPVSYRSGIEITVIEVLKGRAGITTKPLTYAFGFGYGQTRWQVNLAVQKHQYLGFSPGLDVIITP